MGVAGGAERGASVADRAIAVLCEEGSYGLV